MASLSPFTGSLSRHNPSTLRTEKLTMNIQTLTHTYTYTHARMRTHTHTHTHARTHACIHVFMCSYFVFCNMSGVEEEQIRVVHILPWPRPDPPHSHHLPAQLPPETKEKARGKHHQETTYRNHTGWCNFHPIPKKRPKENFTGKQQL